MRGATVQRLGDGLDQRPFAAARERKTPDSGQTLLEFALMLPFLLLLATGIVEIGRAIFYTMAVNNAATAGVEYGAQSALTMVDAHGMETSAINDANFAAMTAHASYGCTCDNGGGSPAEACSYPIPGPPSVCQSISCPNGQVVECVQVTTQATFTALFHYPGLPASYQANGEAVMRVRR